MIYCTFQGEVTEDSIAEVYTAISMAESSRSAMYLYINSIGGDVDAGVSLAIRIRNSKANITTIALGNVSSIALLIYAAGHKRLCSKHTVFLFHELSAEVSLKKVTHIARSLKLRQRDNVRMIRMLSEYSGMSEGLLNQKSGLDEDWEFGADEAKKLKLVQKIYDL